MSPKGSDVWKEDRGGMFACAFSVLQLPKAGWQAVKRGGIVLCFSRLDCDDSLLALGVSLCGSGVGQPLPNQNVLLDVVDIKDNK